FPKHSKISSLLGLNAVRSTSQTKIFLDGLTEMNIVYAPDRAIGKNDPFNSLVCGIVNCLPDVNVFELNADCFDLDETSAHLINLQTQIKERSADRVLALDLMILVITPNVREHVVYDGYGVGFTDVFLLDCSQNALVAFHLRCNSVSHLR